MYVPYDGSNGGPFAKAQEAWDWMKAVDFRNRNSQEGDQSNAGRVYGGVFTAVGGVNAPEAVMLYAGSRLLHQKTGGRGGSLFYDHQILEGQVKDIANWIAVGEEGFNKIPRNGDYEWAFEFAKGAAGIRTAMASMAQQAVDAAVRLS